MVAVCGGRVGYAYHHVEHLAVGAAELGGARQFNAVRAVGQCRRLDVVARCASRQSHVGRVDGESAGERHVDRHARDGCGVFKVDWIGHCLAPESVFCHSVDVDAAARLARFARVVGVVIVAVMGNERGLGVGHDKVEAAVCRYGVAVGSPAYKRVPIVWVGSQADVGAGPEPIAARQVEVTAAVGFGHKVEPVHQLRFRGLAGIVGRVCEMGHKVRVSGLHHIPE